eukprot:jgi/Ulvmu1/10793/UM069_0027.1
MASFGFGGGVERCKRARCAEVGRGRSHGDAGHCAGITDAGLHWVLRTWRSFKQTSGLYTATERAVWVRVDERLQIEQPVKRLCMHSCVNPLQKGGSHGVTCDGIGVQ